MVNIRDEEGRILEKRAAMSWHDYYCKKDITNVTYARLLKCEFWVIKLAIIHTDCLFYFTGNN